MGLRGELRFHPGDRLLARCLQPQCHVPEDGRDDTRVFPEDNLEIAMRDDDGLHGCRAAMTVAVFGASRSIDISPK